MPLTFKIYNRSITAIASVCYLFCSLSLILLIWGSRKGFDLTDEGTYMLLYAYPSHYLENWTGFHLLLSSIQSFIPVSIINLRLIKIFTTLFANVFFATAFLSWLSSYCSRFSELPLRFKLFLFALLFSAALMPYTLLPQTPGYNDVAGIFGLLTAGSILLTLRPTSSASLSVGRMVTMSMAGYFLVFVTLGKWSSGAALLLLIITVIPLGLPAVSPLAIVCGILCFLVGIFLGLGTVHVWVVDLFLFCKGLKSAVISSANHEHPPVKMLLSYGKELLNLFLIPIKYGWWGIILTVALSCRSQKTSDKEVHLIDKVFIFGIIGNLLYYIFHKDLFRGSNAYVSTSVRAYSLIAILLFTFWATRRLYSRSLSLALDTPVKGFLGRRQIAALLLLLTFLPLCIAVGTVGSLFSVGVYAFAGWLGILIILALHVAPYRTGRAFSLILLLISFCLIESQFVSGYLFHPYRQQSPLFKQTETVSHLPKGEGLKFDVPTAAFLTEITQLYRAASPSPNQPIVALYDLPGLVYLLGGISSGTLWYQEFQDADGIGGVNMIPQFPTQTPAISNGSQSQPAKPFLLLQETLRADVDQVLRSRLGYPTSYRLVGSVKSPYDGHEISLWIPKEL